jgi:hypothetical protein
MTATKLPRPAPLPDAERAKRAPPPPESLVNARHDRVHAETGRLIRSEPLETGMKPESDVERARRCVAELAGEAICDERDIDSRVYQCDVRALASEFAAVRAEAFEAGQRAAMDRIREDVEAYWAKAGTFAKARGPHLHELLSPSPKTEQPTPACGKPYSGGDCRLTRGHAGHCQD